jgi:antitoxin VapB
VNLLIDPYISFDLIGRDELNRCLRAWGHKMGPLQRPLFKAPCDYVLRLRGEPLAVVASDTLIRPTCELTRGTAFEMSRMCSAPGHRGISSLMMRMWRAFAYPQIVRAWGAPWVISYQDAVGHTGNLYRYDGWLLIGYSVSGKDPRALPGTTAVRRKKIWAWNADPAAMAGRAKIEVKRPAWARAEKKAA